ncbi:gastrula zinc finger protein XlCGF26.1 isoform X3 [Folsomia candida]|nr:gastrula zinc finger protein XlCGF26.1 isoform X3 [Folsomia candida]
MKDPLQQSGDDDEEFPFCITPHAAKRRKMRPTEEIRATRESPRKTGDDSLFRPEQQIPAKTENLPSELGNITPHKFKCTTCQKLFAGKERMLRHVERGHPFACTAPTCSSTFGTEAARNVHLRSAHPGLAAYECPLCARKFHVAHMLVRHMVIRHETGEKKFPCDKCGKSFALEENLQRHVDLHNFEVEKPLVCSVCDSRFEDDGRLLRHAETHVKKRCICTECGSRFSNKLKLESHVRVRHVERKWVKCDQCQKSFIRKATLVRHVTRVHAPQSETSHHVCHICGKSFRLMDGLKTHLRAHDESKKLTCDTCGEKFTYRTILNSHRVREHGADPFVCHECGTTFSSRHGFRRHLMAHRGEKPHKCDMCDARFLTTTILQNHRTTHTGERPFPCPHCESAFKVKKHLTNHVNKLHTPGYVTRLNFRCAQCEKGYPSNVELQAHVRQVHTGERPFVCEQDGCAKAFAQKRSLVLHLRNTHKIGDRKSGFKLPSRRREGGNE